MEPSNKQCAVRIKPLFDRNTAPLNDTTYPRPIAVQLYSNSCPFCAEETPHFIVASKYFCGAVDFMRYCVDQDEDEGGLVDMYKVEGLPAICIVKKGRLVAKHEGSARTEEIVAFVKGHT